MLQRKIQERLYMSNSTSNVGMLGQLEHRFDALEAREQTLLFWGIPITIMVVAFLIFIEPLYLDIQKQQSQIKSLDRQVVMVQTSLSELERDAQVDPNANIKLQIKGLSARLAKLDAEFDGELSQLIAPETMPSLLNQLFEQTDKLQVLTVTSIAPQLVFSEDPNAMPIFKHGIEIVFEGGFFATRDFLFAAESLPFKLYWQNLTYKVQEHPKATTTLSLFTLSTSEAFISVY